ncbi:Spermidine export protein MdtI [Candidatus Methanobinarius endosymbioticus]|uniref:Spermidine export protein MdtI n=1 Tax=Candidatus Methanobinarius endosymbioticus TaxID=2006182 RepID=A0A366MD82_9EURY|nr:Spermidine export protein MdtI [Candidatus Methanobinarius endosymbioticus]
MNPWIYLIIVKIGWAISLKFSEGFKNVLMTILTIVIMIGSVFFLSIALKDMPIGTAYAIWTALGAVGVTVVEMVFF